MSEGWECEFKKQGARFIRQVCGEGSCYGSGDESKKKIVRANGVECACMHANCTIADPLVHHRNKYAPSSLH